MSYFRPKVIYHDPDEDRGNALMRYIAHRVMNNNKNFLCAVTGMTGAGKSWSTGSMAEIYSSLTGIEYNPKVHVIFSFKQLLDLINSKDDSLKLKYGSVLTFDEPQVTINSRTWKSQANQAFNSLISTFRNLRLVIFFATPYMEFLDKQSRVLFHAEFKIMGFDKETKMSKIKPRFLEYMPGIDDFYRKRLEVTYKEKNKPGYNSELLDIWEIPAPSDSWIKTYEELKASFTLDLNQKLGESLSIVDPKEKEILERQLFLDFVEKYQAVGENYIEMIRLYPQLSINTLEKWVRMVKKSKSA